jgi:acyl carrier protein
MTSPRLTNWGSVTPTSISFWLYTLTPLIAMRPILTMIPLLPCHSARWQLSSDSHTEEHLDPIQLDVIAIVAAITKTPARSIGPDTDLRLDLNVDSLQGLQIVAALENHFQLQLPDEDLDATTSVRSIVEVLQKARARA